MAHFAFIQKPALTALMLGISLLLPCSHSSAQTLPDYLPTDGLVAWWPFNGNANDESGNGNHGIIHGGITSTTDRGGISESAFLFDGTSGFISVPSLNDQPYTPVSYSAWVIVNSYFPWSFGHKFRTIIGRNNAFVVDNGAIGFWADNSALGGLYDNTFLLWRGGGVAGAVPTSIVQPVLNAWTHVVYTQTSSGDWKWYVNGQITNVGNFTDSQNDFNSFQIGSCNNYSQASPFWNDKLDDIGIWNRALTDAEVMALYLGEPPVVGCTDPTACNFNPEANAEDNSCVYPSCADLNALNFNFGAICIDNSTCEYLPDYMSSEGLIALYPLDGNAEPSMLSVPAGVVSGAFATADRHGVPGMAMEFDGNDVISIADNQQMRVSDFTISVWAQLDYYGGPIQLLAKNAGTGPYESIDIVGWGAQSIMCNIGGPTFWGIWLGNGIDGLFPRGVWNHVVYSFSDAQDFVRTYVNGSLVLQGNELASIVYDAMPWTLGAEYEDGQLNWWLDGKLDEFALWNRALTDAEVMALYLGEPPMWGCVDPTACNFNPEANADDGSCVLSGCTDAAACNFDADAGCDDGSCAPADAVVGCMEPGACNFNAAAVCAGTCVYPAAGLADCVAGGALCGEGMVWDVAAQTCTIDPDFVTGAIDAAVAEALDGVCGPGTVWDSTLGMCTGAGSPADCPSDLNGNGSIGIEDLLILLSEFATFCPVPEPVVGACGDLSTVTFDGYSYPLVAIGSQCWFKENLRTAHYRNGDPIPGELSDAAWTSTTAGAQAVYNEDPANLEVYGRLYNWFAVDDARDLCPTGWHVPTDGEWMELEMELGMTAEQANSTGWRGTDQGAQLKATLEDLPGWIEANFSGFSARPGGYRNRFDGGYYDLLENCQWWTSTNDSYNPWYRYITWDESRITRWKPDAHYGVSVRCLRD